MTWTIITRNVNGYDIATLGSGTYHAIHAGQNPEDPSQQVFSAHDYQTVLNWAQGITPAPAPVAAPYDATRNISKLWKYQS